MVTPYLRTVLALASLRQNSETSYEYLCSQPLALGLGEGAIMEQPLAIAVISGLVIQLPLVLWVMPIIYHALRLWSRRVKQSWRA